jgi:hypothetical protein
VVYLEDVGHSYQTRRQRVAQTLRFIGMTAVEVWGSVDELTKGTVGSVVAATDRESVHIENVG